MASITSAATLATVSPPPPPQPPPPDSSTPAAISTSPVDSPTQTLPSSAPGEGKEVSPFEDPTPNLVVPTTESSETNPFRVRNSSSNFSIPTPILSAFPTDQTMAAEAAPPSPLPKSKNPFLDLHSEDNVPPPKASSEEVKTSPRKPVPPPTNGHSRPRPPKPSDPNAPLRPRSPHRRPRDGTNRPSDRDKERDRYRERRDRVSTDPSRRSRPRSVSESSLPKDRSLKREDGHVHKSRSKIHDKKDDKKKSSRRLHPVDKIDLLDVTGAFGIFHHDGPFDACRPHRNKQPHKAPVAAFPADSLTNTLAGGLGEVPGLDRNKYFGIREQEAFQDFGVIAPATQSRRTSDPEQPTHTRSLKESNGIEKIRPSVGVRSTSFDPRLKTEPIHGIETAGLGTSTFLEGAPAPKAAIERAMNEEEEGGLTRKKSIVQKITGRRGTGPGDRSPPPPLNKPLLTPNSPVAESTYNPFFKEGQFIEKVESLPADSGRERADSGGSERGLAGTSGLINRVKSLKISGGRKGKKVEESS